MGMMGKIDYESNLIASWFSEYEDALIGVSTNYQAVYEYEKIVEILMNRDEMTEEEAIDWVEYNVLRAIPYMGENPPVVIHRIEEG